MSFKSRDRLRVLRVMARSRRQLGITHTPDGLAEGMLAGRDT